MLLGAQINPFLIPRSAIFGWCTSYALCQILRFLSPSSSLFLFGWGNNLGLSGISFGVVRNFLGLFRIPTLSARFFPLPQFLWCCTSTEYGHQGLPYFAAGQKDRVAFSRLARRKILNISVWNILSDLFSVILCWFWENWETFGYFIWRWESDHRQRIRTVMHNFWSLSFSERNNFHKLCGSRTEPFLTAFLHLYFKEIYYYIDQVFSCKYC